MSSPGFVNPRRQNEKTAHELIMHRLKAVMALFEDPKVTEVNINGAASIWITREGRRVRVEGRLIDELELAAVARELASAQGQDARADETTAMVHAKMPGFRFSACLFPIAAAGTSLNIRKHSPRILALQDYVQSGTLPAEVAGRLAVMVRDGANILVAGGTDSGKTTFLNALSREIPEDQRVGTVEDTRELMLAVPNWLALEYNRQQGITATMCVDYLMRSSPDRIIVGEMKDEVAASFLEAANTGHHGLMGTIHANDPLESLKRLELLALRANTGVPIHEIRSGIATRLHAVVHLRKHDGRRELTSIVALTGYSEEHKQYRVETLYQLPGWKRGAELWSQPL